MVDRDIRGVIVFICSLLFVCGCDGHVDISETGDEDSIVTLLERKAIDSLFVNNAYSRSLLRKSMSQTTDSLVYYRLMNVYSKACFAASQFDSALYYNRVILRFCQKYSDTPQIHDLFSVTYNMMGNVWGRWNLPDSAVVYYQKAYEHRKRGNELSYLPDICINLADGNVHKSDYVHAAYYYRRALFLCDSLGLPDRNKFPIYYGLGQTYMELRDFDLSNYYYEMAGRYFSQMSVPEKFTYLNNRGNHFYYKKDYGEASCYMERALAVVAPYSQMIFEQNLCKANLGELYVLTDRLDSAQLYLNDSYRFFSEMNNRSAMYYIETQMIELALRQGDVSLASRIIAHTVPDEHVDANMINIRNQYLQHYFEQTGDYRRAYEYLRRDQELNDSIRNERVRTRVAELDMRYSQDTIVMRRELLIEKQSGEMEVLRLTSYIWAIACVASVVVLFFLYRLMKKKRAFLQERLLNQISRLRMENIRNHVSPHFTFNVLNHEISRFKGTDRERSGLVDLVKLLRRSLELTEKLSVPLREELDFVQTYIGLERDRLGEDFMLDLSVDTALDMEKVIVPSMIVQIPVENAIKHGLAGIEGEKRLDISVTYEKNGVRITVVDNGRGYLPQVMSSTRGTGTGLKVLYQTIQLLNAKNKGEKIRFEITNLADGMRTGTCVSVYIPCNYSYDL